MTAPASNSHPAHHGKSAARRAEAPLVQEVPEGYFVTQEATKRMGVSRQRVLHRVQRGELDAVLVCRGQQKGLRIKMLDDQSGLFDEASRTKGHHGDTRSTAGPAGRGLIEGAGWLRLTKALCTNHAVVACLGRRGHQLDVPRPVAFEAGIPVAVIARALQCFSSQRADCALVSAVGANAEAQPARAAHHQIPFVEGIGDNLPVLFHDAAPLVPFTMFRRKPDGQITRIRAMSR